MNRQRRCAFTSIAIVFFLFTAVAAWAAITGSISGVITDPSGALTPGVTVVVTSQSTGAKHTTVTDSKGFYSVPALDVDSYDVSASQQGFRDFLEQGVKVDANSAVRVDISLQVGAVNNVVTVQSNALQVETENTQMGEVITGETIAALPLNGRSFIDLLALQPGVSPYQSTGLTKGAGLSETGVSGDLTDGTQSVNGGRTGANGFMVNGGDSQEGVHNGAALIPNLDSIAEFRIITNNFNAEYGNYSGGQINVVTKSGTNSFHGDAFDFLRNTDLDARNYYSPTRGVYIQNQFGGTLGGPIKKNKIFFFVDYQGTRQTIGQTQFFPVPTNADRAGSLSDQSSAFIGATPANGGTGVNGAYFASVLSQELGYPVTSGEPYYTDGCVSPAQCVFPNAVIPQGAWSPVAVNTLKYIPAPNSADGSHYQTAAFPSTLSDNKYGIRGDVNTRIGQAFAYFFQDKFNGVNPYTGVNIPGFSQGNIGDTLMGDLGLTTTFSSNTVNDIRVVYLRDDANEGTIIGGLGVTLPSLGFNSPWNNTGGLGNVFPADTAVPQFGFNNYSFGSSTSITTQVNNTIQVIDNWTKVIGTHSIQAGGDFHYDQIIQRHPSTPNGAFSFNGSETGLDFADYLIGAPASFSQQSFQILDTRDLYYGAYVQDSWRARPTLTINYGLRWEVSTPWYDATNKLEALVPGEQSLSFPGAPLGLVVPLDPGIPRTLAPIAYNNFAPRVGIAYAPSVDGGFLGKLLGGPGKTSIRTGYGLFYQGIEDATSFYESGDAPYGSNWVSPVPPLLASPYIDRPTGNFEGIKFPFQYPPKNVSPSHPFTNFPWAQVEPISGSEFYYIHNVTPYSQQFELSVQREFGNNTVMSLSYVGTVGTHLLTGVEANPGNQALCLFLSNPANVAPGSATCGPFGEQVDYTEASGQAITTTRALGLNGIGSNPWYKSAAHSSYNSLQASLKSSGKWGNFLIAYTYSKAMDNGSDVFDATNCFNPAASYGLSIFDVRNNFAASYAARLPFDNYFGKGDIAKRFTAGWSLAGLTTLASGEPVRLSESDDRDLVGDFSFPFDTPSAAKNGSSLYTNRNPRSGQPYFNPNYFMPNPIGQVGDISRRFFSGPGIDNYNLSLLKDTQITERTQLQFRAEAFNVFNHAQFNNPAGSINNTGTGGFGYVTSARDPRIMQVALKLVF
jgi:Carboxypeptidase regulatory-like domain